MPDQLDPYTASQIIHSLTESAQPPKLGALHLNVGTEALLSELREKYLKDQLLPIEGRDGWGVCKWIVAEHGNGKTQFLRCMQAEAWEQNFVTAFVELSQDECPLDRPDQVYSAVARSLQAQPLTPEDADRGRGLEVTLRQLLDRMFSGALSGPPNEHLKAAAIAWVESSLAATPVESTGFRNAAVGYLLSELNAQPKKAHLYAMYLKGETLPAPELKKINIYEKFDKSSGFRFLRSLCQLLQRSGLAAGTALLFDEARRSLSLMSAKAQKVACENLLNVINRCNSGDLPGTIFLYAVMPEFFTTFATSYPALQQRCNPSTRINLELLEGIKEHDLLVRIGDRITDVFRLAFPDSPGEDEKLKGVLHVLAEQTVRKRMMGGGTRRLLVNSWVRALHQFREAGVKELALEDVDRLIEGSRRHLDDVESETVAGEGE